MAGDSLARPQLLSPVQTALTPHGWRRRRGVRSTQSAPRQTQALCPDTCTGPRGPRLSPVGRWPPATSLLPRWLCFLPFRRFFFRDCRKARHGVNFLFLL